MMFFRHIGATLLAFLAASNVAFSEAPQVTRSFVDGAFGQVHVRTAAPAAASEQTPVVLFHPSPYSSDFYRDLLKELGRDRLVYALDTPGYGDSAPPPRPQSLEAYASALAVAIRNLGYGAHGAGRVDVMGYHTGALIAAEIAAANPDLVRKLALPGLPFYVGEARRKAYEENVVETKTFETGAQFDAYWTFAVTQRNEDVSLARAQEHFIDAAQAVPRAWWAYHGAFTYPSEDRFGGVEQPVLLLVTGGGLRDKTRAAAGYFPNASIIEAPHLDRGMFDLHNTEIAEIMRAFLDQ